MAAPSQRRALGALFAVLALALGAIAAAAARGGTWPVAVAAAAIAAWMASLAAAALRGR